MCYLNNKKKDYYYLISGQVIEISVLRSVCIIRHLFNSLCRIILTFRKLLLTEKTSVITAIKEPQHREWSHHCYMTNFSGFESDLQ